MCWDVENWKNPTAVRTTVYKFRRPKSTVPERSNALKRANLLALLHRKAHKYLSSPFSFVSFFNGGRFER